MVRPVGGSSTKPVTPETNVEQTTSTTPQSERASTQSSPAQTPASQPAVGYHSDAQSARRAEHSMSGQARAAQLRSGTSGMAGTPSSPGGIAPPAGEASTPVGPAAALANGSTGPEVEQLQEQLNTWRSTQGQEPIQTDGRYGTETRHAVTDFQTRTGLEQDGVAGSRTRDRLALETDPNFRSLNSDTQNRVRDLMNQYSPEGPSGRNQPENQASRTNLMNLASDENFARLSPEGQRQALDRFTASPADPDNTQLIRETVADRANLEQNSNFRNLNADTRQQVLTQLETYHRNSAARINLMNLATEPNFGRLSRSNQDYTLRALDRNPSNETYAGALRLITRSDNFRGMDDANRSRILDMAANNSRNPDYLYQLSRLTTDPNFGSLSTRNQSMTLNVFENTTPNGRQALRNLLNREINGQPALTSRGYGNTGTLLEQLNRASTTPLDSRLTNRQGNPIPRSQVTAQLLQEVSNPDWYINQNNRGTCSVTSDTHRLAAQNPAEYARLVTDLSTTGQSRLANGDTIRVPGTDAWQTDTSNRSHGERLLQSALMSYGHPSQTYQNWNAGTDGIRGTADDGFPDPTNPNGQNSMDGFSDTNRSGLSEDEHARVLSGIHGRNYEAYTGSANFRSDQTDMVNRTREELRESRGPVHVSVQWGGGRHAVEVTEIRDGRVYFRNPWGGRVGATGAIRGTNENNTSRGPLRAVENGGSAIESMTIQDFQQYVRVVYVPE